MTVSINQPAYLPWLGYFDRIAKSDIHIVLDHVQFEKNSMTNRNKIKTKEGWCWLTVPLITKGKFGNLAINEVEILNDGKWQKKHWETIKMNYSKTTYFKQHSDFFENVYGKNWTLLNDLVKTITSYLLNQLNINTKILYSSEIRANGVKDELVLNLCKETNAKKYISGPFGRDYLDLTKFVDEKIEIVFHDYIHPTYAQYGNGFEPYLSVLDLLFNQGQESLKILTNAS